MSAEDPSVAIRMVVAGEGGVFHPSVDAGPHRHVPVSRGQVIGTIDRLGAEVKVTCPFSGLLMGMLAEPGERVRPNQPLAWVGALEDLDDAVA